MFLYYSDYVTVPEPLVTLTLALRLQIPLYSCAACRNPMVKKLRFLNPF